MLILIIVLVAVALVLAATTGLTLVTRRRRAVPPAPSRPTEVRPARPPQTRPPQTRPPTTESPPGPLGGVAVEEPTEAPPAEAPPPTEVLPPEAPEAPAPAPAELLEPAEAPRFRDRLGRARSLLGGYITSVRARDKIDEGAWEELEEALILADVGATVTAKLLDDLRLRVKQEGIESPDGLIEALKGELVATLDGDRQLHTKPGVTNVWLFVGVNGVGKTTTIGKVGRREVLAGRKVVMAAGDTFRAAAAEQLEMWADRVGASLIKGNEGGDPGAVVFDAVQHATARHADLVLADTAGRLHTKTNLMEELKKVRRVAERPPGQVTEVLLVIDATTGQNGLVQARQFGEAVGVTGIVLTKLDGTAKGGIVVAIRSELGLPIKLVGLGEKPEDLVDFDPVEFVDALVDTDPAPAN